MPQRWSNSPSFKRRWPRGEVLANERARMVKRGLTTEPPIYL